MNKEEKILIPGGDFINKQPVYYLQTDERWKNIPYAVKGETTTIGDSGCGPTSAAMILSTILNKSILPTETCAWALKNGYKALNQGTYYSYFVSQFKYYGLDCLRLNESRILNQPQNSIHDKALDLLKNNHYIIALMGPGTWTKSGHFIVVWWEDGKYFINDPASMKDFRIRGDYNTFRKECRMYWAIKIPDQKEETTLDQQEFNKLMNNYLEMLKKEEPSSWSKDARVWAEKNGLIVGDKEGNKQYKSFMTREEAVVFMKRLSDLK